MKLKIFFKLGIVLLLGNCIIFSGCVRHIHNTIRNHASSNISKNDASSSGKENVDEETSNSSVDSEIINDTEETDGFEIDPIEDIEIDTEISQYFEEFLQTYCDTNIKIEDETFYLAGYKLNRVLEDGLEMTHEINGILPSCQVSNEIILRKGDVNVKVKVVNPYEKQQPITDCIICWIRLDETSGNVTDSHKFSCQSALYESVEESYKGPYLKTESSLIFKATHISPIENSIGKNLGEKLLDDDGWEVHYEFQNGILDSITMESPSLLYNGMADNIDPSIIGGVEPATFQSAIQTRDTILEQLKNAFNKNQVNVQIDENTGEIVMDSSVLFEVDSYELSDEGKEILDKFCNTYTSVILSSHFSDKVSAIVFEGHTDTNGAYEYNLQLSQKRADSVLNYCLNSDNNGMTQDQRELFQGLSQTKGYSFSDPIIDGYGNIDMTASRRVAVKFYINVE